MTEPGTYRQTMLRLADRCPHSAWLSTQVDVPSHPMYRGRAFHETIARAITAMAANGEPRIAVNDIKAILVEVIQEHPDWIIPADDHDALRIMCQHMGDYFTLPSLEPLVEAPFALACEGKIVTGTLDLAWVDGDTLHIRDWKAGWGLFPQDDVSGKDPATGRPKGAKSAQLIIYALLAADGEQQDGWVLPAGVTRFDCRFVFPMFTDDNGLVERGLVIERHELIEHREWLWQLVTRMASAWQAYGVLQQADAVLEEAAKDKDRKLTDAGFAAFPAVAGTHCSQCPAPQRCPIPADLRVVNAASPYEHDPEDLALKAEALDQERKRIMASLKGFVEQHGPVRVGADQELAVRKITSSRTDAKAKERLSQGEVVPAEQLFKQSTSTRFGLFKRETA